MLTRCLASVSAAMAAKIVWARKTQVTIRAQIFPIRLVVVIGSPFAITFPRCGLVFLGECLFRVIGISIDVIRCAIDLESEFPMWRDLKQTLRMFQQIDNCNGNAYSMDNLSHQACSDVETRRLSELRASTLERMDHKKSVE